MAKLLRMNGEQIPAFGGKIEQYNITSEQWEYFQAEEDSEIITLGALNNSKSINNKYIVFDNTNAKEKDWIIDIPTESGLATFSIAIFGNGMESIEILVNDVAIATKSNPAYGESFTGMVKVDNGDKFGFKVSSNVVMTITNTLFYATIDSLTTENTIPN